MVAVALSALTLAGRFCRPARGRATAWTRLAPTSAATFLVAVLLASVLISGAQAAPATTEERRPRLAATDTRSPAPLPLAGLRLLSPALDASILPVALVESRVAKTPPQPIAHAQTKGDARVAAAVSTASNSRAGSVGSNISSSDGEGQSKALPLSNTTQTSSAKADFSELISITTNPSTAVVTTNLPGASRDDDWEHPAAVEVKAKTAPTTTTMTKSALQQASDRQHSQQVKNQASEKSSNLGISKIFEKEEEVFMDADANAGANGREEESAFDDVAAINYSSGGSGSEYSEGSSSKPVKSDGLLSSRRGVIAVLDDEGASDEDNEVMTERERAELKHRERKLREHQHRSGVDRAVEDEFGFSHYFDQIPSSYDGGQLRADGHNGELGDEEAARMAETGFGQASSRKSVYFKKNSATRSKKGGSGQRAEATGHDELDGGWIEGADGGAVDISPLELTLAHEGPVVLGRLLELLGMQSHGVIVEHHLHEADKTVNATLEKEALRSDDPDLVIVKSVRVNVRKTP